MFEALPINFCLVAISFLAKRLAYKFQVPLILEAVGVCLALKLALPYLPPVSEWCIMCTMSLRSLCSVYSASLVLVSLCSFTIDIVALFVYCDMNNTKCHMSISLCLFVCVCVCV